jgi:hypothetical protein
MELATLGVGISFIGFLLLVLLIILLVRAL